MNGPAQSEYEHCTASELQGPRVNLTYRWVAQHTASCPPAGVVGCLLPTCAQGLIEPGSHWLGEGENKWSSSWGLVRAAIVRAVWSSKMPLANAPAVLNLLDGPVGVDPAFHLEWSRFRVMQRYLAYCLSDEPRIFRMLDLISRGAQGHGPVHLLLISSAELGFAWDCAEKGWVRVSLPPLKMMTGPVQHFYTSILDVWRFHEFSKLSERKFFLGCEFSDF